MSRSLGLAVQGFKVDFILQDLLSRLILHATRLLMYHETTS